MIILQSIFMDHAMCTLSDATSQRFSAHCAAARSLMWAIDIQQVADHCADVHAAVKTGHFFFFLLQQKSLNRTLSQLVGWAARLAARVKPLTMSCLFPITINLSVEINDNFTKHLAYFYFCGQ